MKRKLKLIEAGDLRRKRVSCLSGDLRKRSSEQKINSDSVSLPGYEKDQIFTANHQVSLSVSDHNTEKSPKQKQQFMESQPEKEMLP